MDDLAVDGVNNLGYTLIGSDAQVSTFFSHINPGLTPAQNDVCHILIAPVDRLAELNSDFGAFLVELTLNPVIAKSATGVVEEVLHVNLAILSINDLHAAILGARVNGVSAGIDSATRTLVGLHLTLGLLVNHLEPGALALELTHLHGILGHLRLGCELVALNNAVSLQAYTCRCANSNCQSNQKY